MLVGETAGLIVVENVWSNLGLQCRPANFMLINRMVVYFVKFNLLEKKFFACLSKLVYKYVCMQCVIRLYKLKLQ